MNLEETKHNSWNKTSARILYLSHDGLMEPLSQSQVWQYLRYLAKGHEITLVTYEKKKDWLDLPRRNSLIEEVRKAGVRWIPLRYHKNPAVFGAVLDLIFCLAVSIYLTLRYRINIAHARNAPFTLIAVFLKIIFGTRFIFDMRGFWADERVDGGLWKKNSLLYRFNKWLEKHYFLQADTVVVLTYAAVNEISKFGYLKNRDIDIEVIRTCTNLDLFYRKNLKKPRRDNGFILGYLGNAGTWYLLDPALAFFNILRESRPEAKMLFINDGQHEYIRSRLEAFDIPDSCVEFKKLLFNESADAISLIDAAVFFIKPVFSKKSSMPTKLGELFACGIPCLTNNGIGDIDQILEKEGVGILLPEFSQGQMRQAAKKLLELTEDPQVSERCVQAAKNYFSLKDGVRAYDKIYKRLAK